MFQILVPTNFTPSSQNAIKYAMSLAGHLKAKITLLHSFSLHDASYDSIIDDLQEENKQKMTALAGTTITQPDTSIEVKSYEGELAHAISQTSPSLIIMGIEGETPFERFLLGNELKKVMEKMPCPILFIPDEAQLTEINNIVYATAYNTDDLDNLRYMVKLTKPFEPEVSLVHMSDGSFSDEDEENFMTIFKKDIRAHIRYKKINYQLLYGKDINQRLELFIHEQHPDMVAMITEQRFLFDRLFHPSATKKMAFHTKIPLLVFSNIYW
ncbi:MAG: universal stress protein [Cyclobacteriaceae bacterium]